MKFKKILFACFIIILALGVVSASSDADNNITAIGDEIAINDANVDETVIGDANESVADETIYDVNASEKEITSDDFYVYTAKGLAKQNDEWDEPQIIIADFPKDGTLQIFVQDSLKFTKNVTASNDTFVSLNVDDVKQKLGIKSSGKDYPISIKYVTDNKTVDLANYRFYLFDEDSIIISEIIGINDKSVLASVTNPDAKYVVGTVKVAVNGKQVYSKKFKSSNQVRFLEIKSSDIPKDYKSGDYVVKVTFTTSEGKSYSSTRTVKFVNSIPEIYSPETISIGENQYITLTSAKGTTGNMTLYNASVQTVDDEISYFKKGDKLLEVNVVNGYASIPLDNLTKGEYKFILEYDVEGYVNSKDISIKVLKNTEGYSAKVTPSKISYGETVKVKFTSPKSSYMLAFVYVDNKYNCALKVKTGTVSNVFYALKVGKHAVRVEFEDGKKYFSKTFDVVVKKSDISLTLDKVKVKKSASKLKLTATLKIKGKAAKNKQIIFKFNKKTFKAKTDKKGVAKVTIPKKYYKDLKVGKDVSYQASYGKVTFVKTVEVQK